MLVGTAAPDFSANAFVKGQNQNIRLNDYRGKWVLMFFYSGDFSFV